VVHFAGLRATVAYSEVLHRNYVYVKELIMHRYAKGQRVQVVSALNSEGNPKYSDMTAYVGEIGIVKKYYCIGLKGENLPSDYYVYEIRIDSDDNVLAIPEDALRPLIG
jgi:hypothetical protein